MSSRHGTKHQVPEPRLPGCQGQQSLPAVPAFWPRLRALPQPLQRSAPEMIVLAGQTAHMRLRQAPRVQAPGVQALLPQTDLATGKTPSALPSQQAEKPEAALGLQRPQQPEPPSQRAGQVLAEPQLARVAGRMPQVPVLPLAYEVPVLPVAFEVPVLLLESEVPVAPLLHGQPGLPAPVQTPHTGRPPARRQPREPLAVA